MKKILKVLKAFTLIELLISIVAIALVTSAMAPIITKKVKASRTLVDADQVRTQPFCNKFSSDCHMCYPKKCIVCDRVCGEVNTTLGKTSTVLNKDMCRCALCNSGKPTSNPNDYDPNNVTNDPNCYSCTFGSSKCNGCMPGFYFEAGKCTECPVGHYCEGGTKTKQACPAGQYQDKTKQTECIKCDKGTYNTGTGNTTCKKCDPGYYQDEQGKTSCKACEGSKGKFSSNSGATICSDCEKGNKVNTTDAASACTPCAPGTYTSEIGKTTCTPCPAGQSASSSGCSTCTKCEKGYYASGTGNSACSPCAAGKYASDKGWAACSNCPTGKYSTGAAVTCTDCTSITGCTACVSTNGNCTTCKAGYKNTNYKCTKCEAGYYAVQGSAACSECPAGKYSKAGAASCTVCDKGYYSAKAASSCTPCPAGTKGTAEGISKCTNCPAGYYQGSTGKTSCNPCPVGQRTGASTTGSTACAKCSAGYYNNSTALAGSCTACGTGKYSSAGATACKNCVANCSVCASTSTCKTCKTNYKKNSDGTKCEEEEITPDSQSDCDNIAGATGKLVYLKGKNRCATVSNVTYGNILGKLEICETKDYCCWQYNSSNKVCNNYTATIACSKYSLGSNGAGSFKLISKDDLIQLFKESKGNTCDERTSQCPQKNWCPTGTQHPLGTDGSCEPYIYYHDETDKTYGRALAKISYESKGYLTNTNKNQNKGQAIRCTIGKAKITKKL